MKGNTGKTEGVVGKGIKQTLQKII